MERVKDELYKKERELLNFVELVEEKKIVQLVKLNDDVIEASESVKDADIISSKLIRHLRNLNVTYTFNSDQIYKRLGRLVEDQLVYITQEEEKKVKFYEKFKMKSPQSLAVDRGIQSEEDYEYERLRQDYADPDVLSSGKLPRRDAGTDIIDEHIDGLAFKGSKSLGIGKGVTNSSIK